MNENRSALAKLLYALLGGVLLMPARRID